MPARIPDEVKRQRGTLQRCRTNPAAPQPKPATVGPAPKGSSPRYRATWSRLAKQVEALGVYTASDASAFSLLVDMLVMAAEAPSDMPATARVRLFQAAAAQLGRFGLDPASRGKVSTVQVADDGTADFLFGPRLVAVNGKKP